ncbi:hypothetical protein N4G62_17505 [Sphingomonas sanguinis]|uniref:Uncharacterized protein n=1 Tax=Sphingomonas sanguinis TaxID=33051 RepID=A0ABU5LV69_9SPHN|nr:hypothetical protein [Sphingomonas sanguinis]
MVITLAGRVTPVSATGDNPHVCSFVRKAEIGPILSVPIRVVDGHINVTVKVNGNALAKLA